MFFFCKVLDLFRGQHGARVVALSHPKSNVQTKNIHSCCIFSWNSMESTSSLSPFRRCLIYWSRISILHACILGIILKKSFHIHTASYQKNQLIKTIISSSPDLLLFWLISCPYCWLYSVFIKDCFHPGRQKSLILFNCFFLSFVTHGSLGRQMVYPKPFWIWNAS